VGIPVKGAILALPVLALTLLVFCAFGVLIAGFVILVKRGDPLSGPISMATFVLSGAIFPVEVFPGFVQWLAYGFPPYYGIRGIREALLADADLGDIADELAILAASSVVLLTISMIFFKWSIAQAKRIGLLHST
jgi:ABC-2 type transport system permease protein